MKYKYPLITALLGFSVATAQAQDTGTTTPESPETTPETTETVETPTLSGGEQKVIDKIAGDFSEFAGDDAGHTR